LTDIASAENWGGGSAKALANAGARGAGFFGRLGVGTVNVQALASDHGAGDAIASALTTLLAGGSHGSAGIGAVTDIPAKLEPAVAQMKFAVHGSPPCLKRASVKFSRCASGAIIVASPA
jgi:hypothetical protein